MAESTIILGILMVACAFIHVGFRALPLAARRDAMWPFMIGLAFGVIVGIFASSWGLQNDRHRCPPQTTSSP